MFTKTMTAVCTALVLAAAVGSVAQAQSNSTEWWREFQNSKRCVGGEQSASSAYPSWAVCVGRAGSR